MDYPLPFVAWREGLREGKLLGLKCKACGAVTCPPRMVCGACAGEDLDIIELKKTGSIVTFTVCYVVPSGFEGPYVVAMADLEEGGRIMGRVTGVNPESAGMELIGQTVAVGFEEIPGDYMTGLDTRVALTLQPVTRAS